MRAVLLEMDYRAVRDRPPEIAVSMAAHLLTDEAKTMDRVIESDDIKFLYEQNCRRIEFWLTRTSNAVRSAVAGLGLLAAIALFRESKLTAAVVRIIEAITLAVAALVNTHLVKNEQRIQEAFLLQRDLHRKIGLLDENSWLSPETKKVLSGTSKPWG